MYRVKQIVRESNLEKPLDDLVNKWFSENRFIELVDIKYQSNISAVADSGASATYYYESVLIVYKEW